LSNLRISPNQIAEAGSVTVSVGVENTGKRAGIDTVELYLHQHTAPISLPTEQLRDFARVELEPGQTKNVQFTIRPQDLMLLDRDMLWRVAPGTFDAMIGSSSAEIALRDSFEVKASSAFTGRGISTQPDLAR